jgi:excisionase family DNA binding protein
MCIMNTSISRSRKPFVTTGDAARALGLTHAAVRTLIRDGVLPAIRPRGAKGGHYRIPRTAVKQLAELVEPEE